MEIDRNSPLPLYFQLKNLISEKIKQGNWKPGDKLPTEEELQQQYDLSRTTTRQALRELELEGTINRQAGRGTFVAVTKIQEGPDAFEKDIFEINDPEIKLSWKIIQAGEVPAPADIAEQLQVPAGSTVFRLQRLRTANEVIIGYATSYVISQYIDKIDLVLAESEGTMHYLIKMDLPNCTAERILEALPANRDDSKLLGLEAGMPVLVLTRVLRDPESRPFEYFRGTYRGDRFRYHIHSLPVQP